MGRPDPSYLVVGHLNKVHGTRGEFLVWPLTDHPEGTFAPGVVLFLGTGEGGGPDPELPRLRVEGARPHKRGYLVRFAGVTDRNAAEALRGHYLMRPADEVEPPDEDELFYHELLGMTVELPDGTVVGEIVEVYETASADLLEVKGPERTHMIPFLADLVVEVDLDEARLVVDPPEGLLEV